MTLSIIYPPQKEFFQKVARNISRDNFALTPSTNHVINVKWNLLQHVAAEFGYSEFYFTQHYYDGIVLSSDLQDFLEFDPGLFEFSNWPFYYRQKKEGKLFFQNAQQLLTDMSNNSLLHVTDKEVWKKWTR